MNSVFQPKPPSDSSSLNNSEHNSTHNVLTNTSTSKTILPTSALPKNDSEKRLSKSEDPFRNSNKLKQNIERLNQTLFKRTFAPTFKKTIENNDEKLSNKDEDLSKKERNKQIIEKVINNKKKLRSEHLNQEKKMIKKLNDFKKMDTFFDIQKFLKEINILEDPEFKEFLSNLKANMKEMRIKKPLAIEKNVMYEKIEPALKHSRKKINEFYSQTTKTKGFSILNLRLMNYLIKDTEKNKDLEETELELATNNLKEKLLNLQVIAKNEDEMKNRCEFADEAMMNVETFQELEDIKQMLFKLGISLDDKNSEVLDQKTDAYFKTYKNSADKLRVCMDKKIKETFKRKWIESHSLRVQKSNSNTTLMNSQMKKSQIINLPNLNRDNIEKSTPFITNLPENRGESNSMNKSCSMNSSNSLQTKVKRKLERLINSKLIFPLVNNPEGPRPVIKIARSLTYSNLMGGKDQTNIIGSNNSGMQMQMLEFPVHNSDPTYGK